jgi:serine/threonine protein kinase
LADFGIAHLADGSTTRTAAILGSAHYLSPEQARGEDATIQSDIYACGVVLYEMLEGRPPFEGANALAIATQHLNAPAPELSNAVGEISPALEGAVARALEKEPGARFVDTSEFAATLALAHSEQDATTAFPLSEQTKKLDITPAGPPSPGQIDAEMLLRRSARKTGSLGVLFVVAGLAAGYVASQGIAGRNLPAYPSALYAALPAILAIFLLLSWFNTRSWSYRMDGNAAVVQWGIIGHHRFGVPLRFITTVELKQSLVDRLLGVGTVEVCARDQHGIERRLIMEDLPHPGRTYEELMRFIGRATRGQLVAPD